MRKFNGSRLYKLVKILVNVVTVISLVLALIMSGNSEKYISGLSNDYAICRDRWGPLLGPDLPACDVHLNDIAEYRARESFMWNLGIFLPIVFYGGTFLYRYLFPVKDIVKAKN